MNLINKNFKVSHHFNFPKNFVYFHYKHRLFDHLLNWKLEEINKFLIFLGSNYENILFSSELNNATINEYFSKLIRISDNFCLSFFVTPSTAPNIF